MRKIKKNLTRLTNAQLIDMICELLRYDMAYVRTLEKRHPNVNFKALEEGMSNHEHITEREHIKTAEFYDVQRYFKMYKKSELIAMILYKLT